MYKFLQRNNKKMLAVFGVLLMIVFVLPSSNFLNPGPGGADLAYGYTAQRTLTRGEVAHGREEWELIKGQQMFMPEARQLVPYIYHLGPELAQEIDQHPDLYVLLQDEAKQLGFGVSDERISEVIAQDPFLRPGAAASAEFRRAMRGFLLVQAYVDRVASSAKPSEPMVQRAIAAFTQQASVSLAELTAEQFKPKGPIAEADLQAHFARHVRGPATAPAATGPSTTRPSTTGPASAPASAPATAAAAATTTTTATATSEADSLDFDYRYPDRVKFQYLTLEVKQVRDLVRRTRDEFEWEVAAQKYYQQHQDEFPPKAPAAADTGLKFPSLTPASQPATGATPPATAPAGAAAPGAAAPVKAPAGGKPKAPADETELEPRSAAPNEVEGEAILAADVQPASKPAATATAPTTAAAAPATVAPATATAPSAKTSSSAAPVKVRPFAEVKEEILRKVMEPDVKKLSEQLADKVAQRLTADFAAYRKADAAAQAAAGAYGSFEYLQRVATEIEKELKVRPGVTSKANEWTAVGDLSDVAGVGSASAGGERLTDVARQVDKLGGATLKTLEFARPLTDADGNVYLARFTDAEPAHEPAALAEVKERVEADVRLARGYAAAKAAAGRALADADQRGLASAAAGAGAKFSTTGFFGRETLFDQRMMFMPLPGFDDPDPFVKQMLVRTAFELLDKATAERPHPRAILPLPSQRKFLVVELAAVNNTLTPSQSFRTSVEIRADLAREQARPLIAQYLGYDAVKARLRYRPDRPEEEKPDAPAAAARQGLRI
jgi:hypothetical protein